jgi:hypothetical protein
MLPLWGEKKPMWLDQKELKFLSTSFLFFLLSFLPSFLSVSSLVTLAFTTLLTILA